MVSDQIMPTPGQLAEFIRKLPREVQTCHLIPGGKPTGELWIEMLGIWLRLHDWSYLGDRGRGRIYPGFFGRLRIRLAYTSVKDQIHGPH